MEQVTYRIDNNILYIALEGRVDTTNSAQIEQKIAEIRQNHPDNQVIIDADRLEYISSAGLRVILRLCKETKDLTVINVAPDVYDIFDMTGFTDMIKVEKAYPRLSVEGCEFIAKGANGAVYRYDDETIVKTYYNADALSEIQQERINARKAFVLGVNTAIPYGIVRVGDGYGTVTELLNATSVSKIIKKDPHNLDEAVAYYVDTIKKIHSIVVKDDELPDFKEWVIDWVEFLKEHLPEEEYNKLNQLVTDLPYSKNLMHGDYHTNNIMVQNGETLLIDMDTLSVGHPVLELGSMFNAFVGFSEVDPKTSDDFLGFSFETAKRFWRLSLARYLETDDEAVINEVEEKAMIIGYTRMLRRAIRRNEPDSPVRIARCKEQLSHLLKTVDSLEF